MTAILAVAFVGFMKLRNDVGGIKNLFSPSYWSERASGREFYNPDEKFLKAGNSDRKEVCFTFDDGPHPASCAKLLDVLKDNNVHATFFLVGLKIKQDPTLVKRIIDEGNEVGNHTEDHIRLDTLPFAKVKDQLQQCETAFEKATGGSHMFLFRPPGMRYTDQVLNIAKSFGYVTVSWQIGAKDFTGGGANAELVEKYVMKQIKPGAIILLHDNPITAAAMPNILRRIKSEGYTTCTVSQLLEHLPNPVLVATNAKPRGTAEVDAPR